MQDIEVLVIRESDPRGMGICLKPYIPFVITPSITHEIRNFQNKIAEEYYKKPWDDVRYLIWYLHSGKITWQGLDFNFIYQALKKSQHTKVEKYISELFDILFINYIGLGLPLINCSIVERNLKGISQAFFYLNRINFIKRYTNKTYSESTEELISSLDLKKNFKNFYFPSQLYEFNKFYGFLQKNMSLIKKLITEISFEPMSLDEIKANQIIFETIKNKKIEAIYKIATKNLKILDRAARIQSSEHQRFIN